jgi:photosystem II stability/assembly factor-like uncharacterized protein
LSVQLRLLRWRRGAAALCLVGAVSAAPTDGVAEVLKPLHRGTPHDALFDVAFDGARGIAVGAFGTVLESADGGATWQRQPPLPTTNLALMSVAMRGGKCLAVGQSGLVFTADDCKTWKKVAAVTPSRLLAVDVNAQGVAYAVGGFGTVLRSADGGQTWAVQTIDWKPFTKDGAEPHLYDVHVAADGTPTMVGEFELILRADASGKNWKALRQGERSLFALTMQSDGRAYAVGQSGAVLASSDGGATWRALASGTEAILTAVHAGPKGQLLASGINTVLASKDDGGTWRRVVSDQAAQGRHQAIGAGTSSDGKTRLIVVGSGGAILEVTP